MLILLQYDESTQLRILITGNPNPHFWGWFYKLLTFWELTYPVLFGSWINEFPYSRLGQIWAHSTTGLRLRFPGKKLDRWGCSQVMHRHRIYHFRSSFWKMYLQYSIRLDVYCNHWALMTVIYIYSIFSILILFRWCAQYCCAVDDRWLSHPPTSGCDYFKFEQLATTSLKSTTGNIIFVGPQRHTHNI